MNNVCDSNIEIDKQAKLVSTYNRLNYPAVRTYTNLYVYMCVHIYTSSPSVL